MPLVYSFVAKGDAMPAVLAEHSDYSGNMNLVALECLQKLQTTNETKMTIACDRHTFNFLRTGGFTFLVVADEGFGRTVPFAFLNKVAEEFSTKHAAKAATASAHSMDRTFGPRLKYFMEYYNLPAGIEEADRVQAVQRQVDEVKGIMVENIERVIERGEKLDVLVDKTDDLQMNAEQFQRSGRALRNRMWWNNKKMQCLIIGGVVVLLVIIIVASVCSSGKCS